MYRIEDNYNWKTLKHWRIAVEAGNVTIKKMTNKEISDTLLENALNLLRVDCFPLSLICCRNLEGQKEIWLTSLWAGIFDFLDNKRCLETAGKKMWFGEMRNDEQRGILNAQVASIWIAME